MSTVQPEMVTISLAAAAAAGNSFLLPGRVTSYLAKQRLD